jgi:hypothetical protein
MSKVSQRSLSLLNGNALVFYVDSGAAERRFRESCGIKNEDKMLRF